MRFLYEEETFGGKYQEYILHNFFALNKRLAYVRRWLKKFYTKQDLSQDIWLVSFNLKKVTDMRSWTWKLHRAVWDFLSKTICAKKKNVWHDYPLGGFVDYIEGAIVPNFDADYRSKRLEILRNLTDKVEFLLNENYYSGREMRALCNKLEISVGYVHKLYVAYDIGNQYQKRWEESYGAVR